MKKLLKKGMRNEISLQECFMKKTKLLAVAVALLALGMTACGGGNSSSSKGKSSKHSHDWGQWSEVSPATCDGAGQEKRTCATCNEFETRPTTPLGHQWGTAQDVAGGEGTMAYKKSSCGRTGCNAIKYEISLQAAATAASVSSDRLSSAPTGFIKLKAADSFEFSFNSDVAGSGKLYLRAIMDNWSDSNSNYNRTLFSGKADGTSDDKSVPNLKISVNNTALTVTNRQTMQQMLPAVDADHPAAGDGWSAVGEILYGDDLAVTAGPNLIKYERVDSFNPAVSDLLLIFTPTQA